MSAAYKCDRCGRYYSVFDHPKLNDIPVERIAYGCRDPYACRTSSLDLCEECAKEFVTWWELSEG